MAEQPILYSFRRCPYAMRARLALAISGQAYEHREVALRAKPAAMLAASPKGTVPVLLLPNGGVIDESLDIMLWALERNDPEGWLTSREEALPLIAANDGPFKHHLDRMKYHSRYEGADPAFHRAEAVRLLAPLEARLARAAMLLGERAGLADHAIFPFIRQFANAGRSAWQVAPLPAMRRWLEQMLALPLFEAVMAKYPLWTDAADGGMEQP